MATETLRRPFTVSDYARMRESGILAEDDRVELLDGEVYQMSPIGPRHIVIVNRLNKLLVRQVGDDAVVSIQNPVQLDDYSEPQPDAALLRPEADELATALASPDAVILLIEVADASLAYYRDKKLPRYAAALIPEVWVIDVDSTIIEQYTEPVGGQYTQLRKVLLGQTVVSTMHPRVQIATSPLFR